MKRRKMNNSFFILIGVMLVLFLCTSNSSATPSLGVATNGVYQIAPGDTDEPYQHYFTSDFVSGSDENEGFTIEGSGDILHIFTNWLEYDIYLLTEADAGANESLKFDGMEFTQFDYDTMQADGYKPRPYDYINLGPVCSGFDGDGNCIANDGWTQISSSAFSPGDFYLYSGELTFEGSLPEGAYFFAAADVYDIGTMQFNSSHNGGCNKSEESCTDPFSPKTSSAQKVPEAGTMLLLGSGLIGLGIIRKRIRK